MAAPLDNEEQEKPLDPAVERVRRKLVRFVAINLGLLFLALMAVVVAIVYRAGRTSEPLPAMVASELPLPAAGELLEGEITLPQGARIVGHALSGGVLSLQVQLGDGERAILLYDMAGARMIGRFAIRDEE